MLLGKEPSWHEHSQSHWLPGCANGEWAMRRIGETANGRNGESAMRRESDETPLIGGTKNRWGEELGAPVRFLHLMITPRRFLAVAFGAASPMMSKQPPHNQLHPPSGLLH